MAKAMFGVGCFWAVEAAFRRVPGVEETRAGFSGGTQTRSGVEEVAAQVVLLDYDEQRVAYEDLLAVFWRLHGPMQVNRRGSGVGGTAR